MSDKNSHAAKAERSTSKSAGRVNKGQSPLKSKKRKNQEREESMIEREHLNVLTYVLGNLKNHLNQRKRKLHLSSDMLENNSENLIGLTIHYYRDKEYFESYDTLITPDNFNQIRAYFENKDELEVASLNQKLRVTLISIAKADFENVDAANLEDISLYYLASFKCINENFRNNPAISKGFLITIHDSGFEDLRPYPVEFNEWKEAATDRF